MAFGRTTASIWMAPSRGRQARRVARRTGRSVQCGRQPYSRDDNPIGAKKHAALLPGRKPHGARYTDQVIVARLQGVRKAERAVMKEREHAAISRNPEGTSPLWNPCVRQSLPRRRDHLSGDDSDVRSSDESSNKKTPHMRVRTAGPP